MKDKIALIKNNKSIALLAPSFVIDFKYPQIIGMLRELGFDEVTELTYGARMVNWHYVEYAKAHPEQKIFIASPCPVCVQFVENEYPKLVKYLVPVVSPMAAMARIYRKHHPDYKIVFFAPCFTKGQIEAPKYKECIDAVITYKELKDIFEAEKIKEEDFNRDYFFDSYIREFTKIYPVSGGLAETSHIQKLFKKEEILVTDGINNIKVELDKIKNGKSPYRFLDILNCPGGCVGGPAISNTELSLDQKKEAIKSYINKAGEHPMGEHEGTVEYAEDVDFSTSF